MKLLRYRLIASICLLSSALYLMGFLSQDTQKSFSNQQRHESTIPDSFFKPLNYSKSSISGFLHDTYNHPLYAQHFLALNFAHVTQLLSLAKHHNHPREFIRRGLGLFVLKFNNIYVNSYALCTFLDDLNTLLAPYADTSADKKYMVELLKNSIGSYLTEQFDRLRTQPDQALEELSEKLYALIHQADDDNSLRELQHAVYYFISRVLSLVVWSPDDQADTWHSMVTMGHQLGQLAEKNIIDRSMVDTLYWVLLNRYANFLHIAGVELTTATYDVASESLKNDPQPFWHTDEREMFIQTKFEYIKNALIEAETAAQLQAAGYLQA